MNSKAIRKELAIYRNKLIISGINQNQALNLARKAMNDKYGKEWRNETPKFTGRSNDLYPSIYNGHNNGEHWMD